MPNDECRSALERARTILANMAQENENAVFNRWPIGHEPLRADAKNLLPVIDAALAADAASTASGGEWNDAIEAAAKAVEELSGATQAVQDLYDGTVTQEYLVPSRKGYAKAIRALATASPSPSVTEEEIARAIAPFTTRFCQAPTSFAENAILGEMARAVITIIRGERRP